MLELFKEVQGLSERIELLRDSKETGLVLTQAIAHKERLLRRISCDTITI